VRKIIRKSALLSVLLLVFSGVISCEKDFTDIGTNIVGNTKFATDTIVLEVEVTQRDIDAIRGDNIAIGNIGEYLLGVYQDKDYEKIEASIVSQIALAAGINVTDGITDTTTVTSIFDNAFLKFPYIATRGDDNTDGTPSFTLDSLLGNTTAGVILNVYRNNTFLNTLDPQNTSQANAFSSDFVYEKGELLNESANFLFIPDSTHTFYEYERTLKSGETLKDTLKLTNENPFLVIPLDSTVMKSLFYDKFEDNEFASQDALNNYFRGLIIEASGLENSLIPFSFTGNLIPTLEVNYTNTVEKTATGEVLDTIKKMASFPLSGVQNRIYKMTPEQNAAGTNQVIIQGAAGKAADVKILQGTQLVDLRAKDWLINDAKLTFYIDQDKDTTAIPLRLHLYKEEANYSSQIKDSYSEGLDVFSGVLQKEGIVNDNYTFNITDYISDVLKTGATTNNSNLVLKVYNTITDSPVQNGVLDTIVTNNSSNPRAVTITNHLPSGTIEGTRKAQLKISYSERKN
jgi:hypothetical protein